MTLAIVSVRAHQIIHCSIKRQFKNDIKSYFFTFYIDCWLGFTNGFDFIYMINIDYITHDDNFTLFIKS
ncbi:hypothetical protein NFHSH190041_10580 [Shewanella sp. NFH-SH190041]|nr:hypothetical protein NFHSH190041_10580 [Shewanella sp. NFH-SH190041]